MNSSSAMPISVMLRVFSGSSIRPEHVRPDERAGDDIAQCRAELELAEDGDEDQRRAEHQRAALQDLPGGRGGLGGGLGGALLHHPFIAARGRGREAGSRHDGRLLARAGASASRPGQSPGSSRLPASHSVRSASAALDLFARPALGRRRDQSGAGLAERAGADLLAQLGDRPLLDHDLGDDRASAGRCSKFGAAVGPLQLVRRVERGREAKDFGRVERRAHRMPKIIARPERSAERVAEGRPARVLAGRPSTTLRTNEEGAQRGITPAATSSPPGRLRARCPRPSVRRGCGRRWRSRGPAWQRCVQGQVRRFAPSLRLK